MYKKAGVNTNSAEKLAKLLGKTSFAGVFEFEDYCLSATTDGIGTKIIPLLERDLIDTIANDIVAVNINDLICTGAKPLFFMDYIACKQLDADFIFVLVNKIEKILAQYNCKLIGGETSEINDIVKTFDIAGFMVGMVKKENILKPENIRAGDIIIGLKSSGPHANGYSLIRKLYAENELTDEEFKKMLAPNFIYANEVLELSEKKLIHSACNITGGGILRNINRIIPKGLNADIDFSSITEMPLFQKLKTLIGDEVYNIFNMGVGFCLIANKKNKDDIFTVCEKFEPFILGEL